MSISDRYAIVEVTIVCKECRQEKPVLTPKNCRRKYCDDCQRPVLLRRKSQERHARKNGVKLEKPRLVRYAGYDPSEH